MAALALVAATAAWALALVFGEGPFEEGPAALLAADLLILATVTGVAMVLGRGLWTRRAAAFLLAGLLVLAAAQARDGWWWAGLAATVTGVVAVGGPWLSSRLRRDRRTDAPPSRVVGLVMGLLALPGLIAVAGPSAVPLFGWLLAGFAALAAWGYSRAWMPFVWILRSVLPLLGILAAIRLGLPGGLVLGLAVAGLTILAWTPEAMVAVVAPPTRRAQPVPIPPELVPPNILDEAGYDERGRPRGPG